MVAHTTLRNIINVMHLILNTVFVKKKILRPRNKIRDFKNLKYHTVRSILFLRFVK